MYDVGGKLFSEIQDFEVHMFGFDGVRRGSYFIGEPIIETEVEERVQKLKNGKAVGKDESQEKQ